MIYLLLVTLIWGFSFGLVKGNLAGIDPHFISFARLAAALLVFLPFTAWRKVTRALSLRLMLVGVLQFGFMYVTYNAAFQFLKAYEIALLTITTPLMIVLMESGFERRLRWNYLLTSLMACAGAAVIVFENFETRSGVTGVVLVQASNLCFAFGQVYYRRLMAKNPQLADRRVFGWLYLGAALVTAILSAFLTPWRGLQLNSTHVLTLVYLGVIASGLSFFLWNSGARKVDPGALAIMNDLKIPVAVAISLLFFGEQADWRRLVIGGGIILSSLALNHWLATKAARSPA